jgi:hypothetical protein
MIATFHGLRGEPVAMMGQSADSMDSNLSAANGLPIESKVTPSGGDDYLLAVLPVPTLLPRDALDVGDGPVAGVEYRLPRTLLSSGQPGQLSRPSSAEIRRYDDQRAVGMVQHRLGY